MFSMSQQMFSMSQEMFSMTQEMFSMSQGVFSVSQGLLSMSQGFTSQKLWLFFAAAWSHVSTDESALWYRADTKPSVLTSKTRVNKQ